MQIIDDRTVEIVPKAIWTVLWHLYSGFIRDPSKSSVSGLHFL